MKPAPSIAIRPYRAADFEALFALDKLCFAPRYRFSRAMLRSVVSGRDDVVRVAEEAVLGVAQQPDAMPLVGFCAAKLEAVAGSPRAYVNTLDVMPQWQRRGLGRALLRAVETEVQRAGARDVGLHVSVENEAARRLYEGLGYRCLAPVRDFYGRGFHAWEYGKTLAPEDTATPEETDGNA